MEVIFSRVVSVLATAAAIVALMGIAIVVGNVSGKIIRKILGIGGK